MTRMIFVNLPVRDVNASADFYEAIGCTRDMRFTNPGVAAAMVWSESISFMLLSHEFYAGFTDKPIADTHATSAALLCLSMDSRDAVDAIVDAAATHGGKVPDRPAQDMGFMYGRSFEDPDGHIFEPMWMDVDQAIPVISEENAAAQAAAAN